MTNDEELNEENITIEMDGVTAHAEIHVTRMDGAIHVAMSGLDEPKELMKTVKKIYDKIRDEA